jgi:class 3 adenylate cyclase
LTVGSGAAPEVSGAFAFCDLAGFTAFTAERGDGAALDLVEAFGALVAAALPGGARIVNRIGDGLLVHFCDPVGAIPALLEITHRCTTASTPEAPLWIRTGVHAGRARPLGADLIGHDVNVAARIGDLAAAGEVLASEPARAAAAPSADVRFKPLGPVFVKGVPDPLRLYRAERIVAAVAPGA